MRISDWSSDVCSSDLRARKRPRDRTMPRGSNKNGFARRFRRGKGGSVGRYHDRSHGDVALLLADRRAFPAIARGSARDRKGGGGGKSECVRGELGGCGILKKKKIRK